MRLGSGDFCRYTIRGVGGLLEAAAAIQAGHADHARQGPGPATDPMLPAAALLISGVLLGRVWSPPATIALAAALACWLLWLFSIGLRLPVLGAQRGASTRKDAAVATGQNHWINIIGQIFLAGSIGFTGVLLWQVNQRRIASNNIARAVPARPGARTLIAARLLIISAPQFHQTSRKTVLYSAVAPSTTFFARVLQSRVQGRWRNVTGKVAVRAAGYLPGLKNNQTVRIEGWLGRPAAAFNPGAFNYRRYLDKYRIFGSITARYPEQIRLINRHRRWFPLTGWLDAWRRTLRHRLLYEQSRGNRPAGHALVALLLGYRDPSMRSVARAFSLAGAAHLLALSGLHVVIIAAAIWFLLRLFISRPTPRAILTMLLLLGYMLLTPCGPPVVRAAVGTALVLFMLLRGRPPRILNILAITAIIVVSGTPAEVFEAPFQLSFLITLGLITLGPRVYEALLGKWSRRQGEIARAKDRWWTFLTLRIKQFIAAAFIANLIGSLLAFPLVAYHYNQINPLAVINGLILLPLVSAALVAGLIQMSAGLLAPGLGRAAAMIGAPVANLLSWLVERMAQLPISNIVVRAPPGWLIAGFYLLVLLWVLRRRLRASRASMMVAFVAWATILTGWYALTERYQAVHVWVMDAGGGDALAVQSPTGRVLLINAGSLGSPQRLAASVNTLLRREGLWQISAAITDQIDSNHASALPALGVRHPGIIGFCDWRDINDRRRRRPLERFFSAASGVGLAFKPLEAGRTLVTPDHLRIRILWPPASGKIPWKWRGCILLVKYGRENVLIIGRTQGVRSVLNHVVFPPAIAAVILTGPGNLKPALAGWLLRAHPRYVIACGETRAACRHDRQQLAALGGRFIQTRRTGAVHVAIYHRRLIIASYRRGAN